MQYEVNAYDQWNQNGISPDTMNPYHEMPKEICSVPATSGRFVLTSDEMIMPDCTYPYRVLMDGSDGVFFIIVEGGNDVYAWYQSLYIINESTIHSIQDGYIGIYTKISPNYLFEEAAIASSEAETDEDCIDITFGIIGQSFRDYLKECRYNGVSFIASNWDYGVFGKGVTAYDLALDGTEQNYFSPSASTTLTVRNDKIVGFYQVINDRNVYRLSNGLGGNCKSLLSYEPQVIYEAPCTYIKWVLNNAIVVIDTINLSGDSDWKNYYVRAICIFEKCTDDESQYDWSDDSFDNYSMESYN